MGKTLTAVPFFTDDITIIPHTASAREFLGRPISIREFSQGKAMRLWDIEETKEWIFELLDGTFVEGEEV